MLATAGLVLALRTAACPEGKEIEFMTTGVSYCPSLFPDGATPLSKRLLCSPATPTTPCCGSSFDSVRGLGIQIFCIAQNAESKNSNLQNGWDYETAPSYQCNDDIYRTTYVHEVGPYDLSSVDCTSLLPTEQESGLSAGATAGIVVGGTLGPFALGLAYKTLM